MILVPNDVVKSVAGEGQPETMPMTDPSVQSLTTRPLFILGGSFSTSEGQVGFSDCEGAKDLLDCPDIQLAWPISHDFSGRGRGGWTAAKVMCLVRPKTIGPNTCPCCWSHAFGRKRISAVTAKSALVFQSKSNEALFALLPSHPKRQGA